VNNNNNNNNNSYTYQNGNSNNSSSNNNNGEEISNASNESNLVSKIVGKFPLDVTTVSSPFFVPTYIKPQQQNGLITSYKAPTIVNYAGWKGKKEGHQEAINQ